MTLVKALAVSDKVVPALYSEHVHRVIGDVDVLISCGDVPPYYLDFLATALNVPFFYVLGNHPLGAVDPASRRLRLPREANLHRRVVYHRGLIWGGLEGSRRYRPHAPFQYTEQEMWLHCLALVPRLLWHRLVHGRYLDVLVTHAPPRYIHDAEDLAHQGFTCFRWFMRVFRPRYLLHGHVHVYRPDTPTHTVFGETHVINVYPYKLLGLEPADRKVFRRQVSAQLRQSWAYLTARWEEFVASRWDPFTQEDVGR